MRHLHQVGLCTLQEGESRCNKTRSCQFGLSFFCPFWKILETWFKLASADSVRTKLIYRRRWGGGAFPTAGGWWGSFRHRWLHGEGLPKEEPPSTFTGKGASSKYFFHQGRETKSLLRPRGGATIFRRPASAVSQKEPYYCHCYYISFPLWQYLSIHYLLPCKH